MLYQIIDDKKNTQTTNGANSKTFDYFKQGR